MLLSSNAPRRLWLFALQHFCRILGCWPNANGIAPWKCVSLECQLTANLDRDLHSGRLPGRGRQWPILQSTPSRLSTLRHLWYCIRGAPTPLCCDAKYAADIVISCHVDDILIACSSLSIMRKFKSTLLLLLALKRAKLQNISAASSSAIDPIAPLYSCKQPIPNASSAPLTCGMKFILLLQALARLKQIALTPLALLYSAGIVAS